MGGFIVKLIGRLAVRLGASAMVAAAGLAVTALPAGAAAGVDLAVSVRSGVVAAGSEGKVFTAQVTNLGDTKSGDFDFVLNLASLDTTKVTVALPTDLDEFCEPVSGAKIECGFGNVLVRNDSLEIPIIIKPVSGATAGPVGSFAVSATTAGDTNTGNNSATAPVSVSKPGVDIVVWADDVTAGRDGDTGEAKRVAPGAVGEVAFLFANDGSAAATGIELVFTLPQHVSVEGNLVGCTVSGNKVTCNIPGLLLLPNEYVEAELPVRVAADAPQSVELKGSLQGRSLGVAEALTEDARNKATRQAPSWVKIAADQFNPNEVDNKDNTDDFVVFVGTTGGGGGGLPVTGPKAIVIGGVGAAVLAVGVFLFVSSRRRRVVLVTPAE
jgi:hypothetical protein